MMSELRGALSTRMTEEPRSIQKLLYPPTGAPIGGAALSTGLGNARSFTRRLSLVSIEAASLSVSERCPPALAGRSMGVSVAIS